MAKASAGKSTLTRQLLLLDSFSVGQPFLTISQLSRRSGLPLSTTHRLMTELADAGLVERLDDKSYRLGVRLWELACRTPGALGLRETASPYLLEAHSVVRQHVQLGIADGRDVLFLERLSMMDAVVSTTIIGGRLPLHASATGLVLLANHPPDALATFLAAPLPSYTEATIHDPRTLRKVLSDVRRQGFAVTDGHIHPSARGVAVPVVGAAGETVAAIGAVVPNDGQPWMHIVETLRTAAQQTATALRGASLPSSDPGASPGGPFRSLVHSSNQSMEFLSRGRRTGG
ncbi:IclR family transcriptional regulator [Leifsonia sp. Leaf264]|uniref:IclR family transcriptional regulator n=1 Tax=Leifsonia sp. Leaf264 TaxID=1736314 RepID=UPI0009E69F8B|nr:IclR family transcriptional regulator [Leifsonia sp. Leaf264]